MIASNFQRPLRIAAIMVIVAGVFALLIVAKQILIPILIACILAYITIVLSSGIQNHYFFKKKLPQWLAHLLSIIIMVAIGWVVWTIVKIHITGIISQIPFYESQLINLTSQLGPDIQSHIANGLAQVNVSGMLGNFAGSIATAGSKIVLVVIYTIFIIIEFPFIKKKIHYFFEGHESQKQQTKNILSFISRDVNAYFKIKTLASLLTAVLCYIVLLIFNVDFPIFWALLIFVLNFIPTIGSITAVLFPAVLTLLQFASFGRFAAILIVLIFVQLLVGNLIEPRIAGRVLNISPLVILLALVVAGALWGVVGMIISVPIVIVVKIVAEQFPGTKLISVLLSRDGHSS